MDRCLPSRLAAYCSDVRNAWPHTVAMCGSLFAFHLYSSDVQKPLSFVYLFFGGLSAL